MSINNLHLITERLVRNGVHLGIDAQTISEGIKTVTKIMTSERDTLAMETRNRVLEEHAFSNAPISKSVILDRIKMYLEGGARRSECMGEGIGYQDVAAYFVLLDWLKDHPDQALD